MSTIETLFSSRWLTLLRRGHWEFIRRPHSESCVVILPLLNDDTVVLIEQFRIPLQQRVIELPAGLVGDEPDFAHESITETAVRELREETGYFANHMSLLLSTPTSAGMTSEITHVFKATDLIKVTDGGGVAEEEIEIHHIPLAHLRAWLEEKSQQGVRIDFKIHAALALANVCFN